MFVKTFNSATCIMYFIKVTENGDKFFKIYFYEIERQIIYSQKA